MELHSKQNHIVYFFFTFKYKLGNILSQYCYLQYITDIVQKPLSVVSDHGYKMDVVNTIVALDVAI